MSKYHFLTRSIKAYIYIDCSLRQVSEKCEEKHFKNALFCRMLTWLCRVARSGKTKNERKYLLRGLDARWFARSWVDRRWMSRAGRIRLDRAGRILDPGSWAGRIRPSQHLPSPPFAWILLQQLMNILQAFQCKGDDLSIYIFEGEGGC